MSDPTPPPATPGSTPPDLGGLNPRDLIAGGLQSAVPRPQGWQPPEPEVLARLLPQYQVEAFLGRGGMGAVYRGRQIALDRAVALKLLPAELSGDAEFVGRFQREARTLAKLQHPGIVAIYDFGQTTEGHLYFVMEYVDGTDLHHIIHGPGVNPAQALEIVAQVCEALQYAHTHGVMHRDIKPANVLLTQDGRAKLADFGLARPTHEDSGGFTRSNVVMGTPDYIAPEQMYGQADHRADLFSLGVMLYEMLTGQTPRGAWAPPSQRVRVDVRLDQVVIRALQHDVAMRYQQASEMKVDVDTIRTTPLPVAQPPPRKPQAPAPQKRPTPAAKPAVAAHERVEPIRRKKSSNSWLLATVLPLLAAGFGYWVISQPKADSADPTAPVAASSKAGAATVPAGSNAAQVNWQKIPFPATVAIPGISVRPDGWIAIGPRVKDEFPSWEASEFTNQKRFGNVAIRLRYKRNEKPQTEESLGFVLRHGDQVMSNVTFWSRGTSLSFWQGSRKLAIVSGGKDQVLVTPEVGLKAGEEGVLEFACLGSRLVVRHNQTVLIDHVQEGFGTQDNRTFRIGGQNSLFRDFEFVALDGVADPLKALGWNTAAPALADSPRAPKSSEPTAPAKALPPGGAAFQPVPNFLNLARAKGTAITGDTLILNNEAEFALGIRPRNFAMRIPYEADRFRYLQVNFRLAAGGICDRVTLSEREVVLAARREPVQRFPRPRPTHPSEKGVLEMAAIDGLLIARLSTGEVFSRTIDPASLKGDLQIGGSSGTKIRDVQYLDLDGVADPMKALGWEVPPSPPAATPVTAGAGASAKAAEPSGSAPVATPLVIPAWLQQARQRGGKVRFFGSGPEGATEKGRAEEFDDVVELRLRSLGWVIRRKNGEAHGVGFAKPSSTAPAGGRPVGPFQISFLGSGNITLMRSEPSGDYRNIFAGGSQHRPDFGVKGGVAFISIGDHVTTLGANGEILRATRWGGAEHLPPADLFRGAQAFAGFKESYLSAKPGQPVISWHVWDQKLTTFPAEISNVVEIHAVDHAILRTASGKVFTTNQSGAPTTQKCGLIPADLGPVIAVRAGRGMSAAQRPDGTWVAWGDSPELIEQTRKIGPALDVGYDFVKNGSNLMMWIEAPAAATATLGGLTESSKADAPPAAAHAFGNSRYLLVQDKKNWEDANKAAKAQGGHLLTITSKEEDDFIRAAFGDHLKNVGNLWLGAVCTEHTKTAPWTWSNGETWTYSNWAPNQPDFGYDGDAHALMFFSGDFRWDDRTGTNTNAFVIEFDATTPASTASSAAPAMPLDQLTTRLADIHAKFQAAYDRDIAPPHEATVATLDSNYLAAVNRALDAATKRGDLDEAVQVRAEAKRVTDKQPMPAEDAESTPAILKTLRATYRTTLASLEKERDAKAKPYFDRYDDLLEDYQKELTQKGKLDDALVVKTRRDELREKGVATSPTKPASLAPEAAGKPQAPVATIAPDAAGEDKFIDWVFSREGELNVSSGGKTVRAKSRQQMPGKPYEIWEVIIHKGGISDKDLAMITAVPTMRHVYITGKNEFTTLKPFAALPELRAVWLDGTPIKEEEVAHLAGLTRLDGLTLNFKNGTGEGLAHLRGSNTLKSVKLINGSLSAAGAQAIAALPLVDNLTLDAFVQRKNQEHLAALAALPNLRYLALTHCQLGEDAFKAIASLKSLDHLNLSDTEFDNDGLAFLAPLGPTLKTLNMQWWATVSDEGLMHVAACLPNLETINVSLGATCTGAGIRELAKLPKLTKISWWVKGMKAKDYQLLAALPAIEHISLNSSEITDDGLAAFPQSKSLTFLNLENTAITDKGLTHLQTIPNLKEVVLKSTKVTPAGLAAFQQARPEVKVSR